MKTRLKIFFVASLFMTSLVFRPLEAKAAALLLFDAHTGEVLFEDLAGSLWHPASLTKMMTLYIALKAIRDRNIDPFERVLVSKNATRQPPSKIGFRAGAKIPLKEAIDGMFIRSANDLALAIAEHVGGSERGFVKLMNLTARELGMNSTSFANPHGLPDDRQITTARDMGILGRALLREFPDGEHLYTSHFAKVRGRKYRSRNIGLLKGFRGADGIKTGFICASGYNLVGSATRNGRQLIAVVLGGTSVVSRDKRVMDLLARGFNDKLPLFPEKLKTVDDIKNQKVKLAPPVDMTRSVCRRKGIEMVKGYQLQDWSVMVANHQSIKKARLHLRDEMIGLRQAVFAGKGVLMRGVGGRIASLVTHLSEEEAVEVCMQLHNSTIGCGVIKPGTYKKPAVIKKPEDAKEPDKTKKQEQPKKPAKTITVKTRIDEKNSRANDKDTPKKASKRKPVEQVQKPGKIPDPS